MAEQNVRFILWKNGAYAISSYDESSGAGALVQHDGKHAMRVVGVSKRSFEESVIKRRAVRGGVAINKSTLSAVRGHDLVWDWSVQRPGLTRTEVWRASSRVRGTWEQVDARPDRVTRYTVAGPRRYQGDTQTPDGKALWSSTWGPGEQGGLTGVYSDPAGEVVGTIQFGGDSSSVSWDGPESSGSIATADPDGVGQVVVSGEGVNKTYTRNEGDGHSVEVGSSNAGGLGRYWIKITVPGKGAGDSSWVDMGTETYKGTETDYTINGTSHADGSSQFSRIGNDRTTGDHDTVYGGTDVAGNSSYSESIEHSDGSVTLITRSVDSNGDGTEHVTVVDKDGNVKSDDTFPVNGGVTGSTPAPSGDSSGGGSDGSGASGGDPTAGNPDPNDPDQPGQPDAPDVGGGSGATSSDAGDDDLDAAPPSPAGRIGRQHSNTLTDIFGGIRSGDDPGGDDEGGLGDDVEGWRRQLGVEVSAAGDGGGDDDATGWGAGENPIGSPLINVTMRVSSASSGEEGWGDLTNPRALLGYVSSLTGAAFHVAGSANLAQAGPG